MDSLAAVDWTAYEQEALSAIADGALDDARVRYLGRKSELAQALRGVRDRESGMLLNGVRARLEEAVEERERQLEPAPRYEAAAEQRHRRDDPRHAGHARPAAPADADPPRDRGHLPRHGLRGLGRPRGRHRLGELRRAQHRPRPPVAVEARHVLPRRRHDPAHADVARPDQGDADAEAADLHGLAGPRVPPRHAGRDALADVPAGRVPRRRPRDHARRPARHGAAVLPPALRAGPRRPHAHELLPVHRAVGRVRRDLLPLRRPGLRGVQALRLDRDGRRRLGRPRRVPQRRPRPGRVAGLRVRLRDRAHRHAPARPARPARVLGERHPRSWSSSDEGPRLAGCASTSSSTCRSRSSRAGSSSRAARSTASCAAASPTSTATTATSSSARCSRPRSIRTRTSSS